MIILMLARTAQEKNPGYPPHGPGKCPNLAHPRIGIIFWCRHPVVVVVRFSKSWTLRFPTVLTGCLHQIIMPFLGWAKFGHFPGPCGG